MSMNTNLKGRLRNTPLPRIHCMLPVFEAVVNSIHSIAELNQKPSTGEIKVLVIREAQSSQSALQFGEGKSKHGRFPMENIIGFEIIDNGAGFHDKNMESFETLDSDYKAQQGCRGVGRLLWLKAFETVEITSSFRDKNGNMQKRSFFFTDTQGVESIKLEDAGAEETLTTRVSLKGFKKTYRDEAPKTARPIATSLLEHCLWYFVRDGGVPKISIIDEQDRIELNDLYEEYIFSSTDQEQINLKGNYFDLTHIKLKASSTKLHRIAWCAANRVVEEENISGKIPGLHGKIQDEPGDFVYCCYVTSPFLDQHARPERIGFDISAEPSNGLFSDTEISFSEIKNAVIKSSAIYLDGYLQEIKKAGRDRVEKFISQRAPRYRPILLRIADDDLCVDPCIEDKELELLLHEQLFKIEGSLLSEGHAMMNIGQDEDAAQYQARLTDYLAKADDIKKSDLAGYVFHRRVILDILEKAIQRGANGKYAREEVIHELIMPMRKTSNEISPDRCNLWLIDEKLAFHDFLASDKPLSSMPITNCSENKEPDICALNVFDEPLLVAEGQKIPLATLTIIEIKRPMRNDAGAGEEKDPIAQSLGYLQRIREGKAQTASGRPIPGSEVIPGFCYVICDLTSTIVQCCKMHDLTKTSDHLGYFGYKSSFNAYVEVISFDGLIKSARERNRAFFDKLGLPIT